MLSFGYIKKATAKKIYEKGNSNKIIKTKNVIKQKKEIEYKQAIKINILT